MRAVVIREVDRSALEQREDIAKLSVSLRNDLTAKGLQFNDVDRPVFREALGKTTYYKDWKPSSATKPGRHSRSTPARWRKRHESRTHRHCGCGRRLAPAGRHWAAPVDTVLRHLVEIPAALLVVAEIVVLLAGVIGRYVFHEPIIWSDELASILFLWLAMLGSVVALRRGEHMRMTAFVGMASPQTRAFLDVLAIAAALAFLLLIIEPAYHFAAEEIYITTPALEISNIWRAAALPIGTVDDHHRAAAAASGRELAIGFGGTRAPWGLIAALTALQPLLQGPGQPQPAHLFRRHRCGSRLRWRADRVLLRPRHLRLSGTDHHYADAGCDRVAWTRACRTSSCSPCRCSFSWAAHRDDRHGAGHGGFSCQPARACQGRSLLRSHRCDVSGIGISGSKAADMAAVAPCCSPR